MLDNKNKIYITLTVIAFVLSYIRNYGGGRTGRLQAIYRESPCEIYRMARWYEASIAGDQNAPTFQLKKKVMLLDNVYDKVSEDDKSTINDINCKVKEIDEVIRGIDAIEEYLNKNMWWRNYMMRYFYPNYWLDIFKSGAPYIIRSLMELLQPVIAFIIAGKVHVLLVDYLKLSTGEGVDETVSHMLIYHACYHLSLEIIDIILYQLGFAAIRSSALQMIIVWSIIMFVLDESPGGAAAGASGAGLVDKVRNYNMATSGGLPLGITK